MEVRLQQRVDDEFSALNQALVDERRQHEKAEEQHRKDLTKELTTLSDSIDRQKKLL